MFTLSSKDNTTLVMTQDDGSCCSNHPFFLFLFFSVKLNSRTLRLIMGFHMVWPAQIELEDTLSIISVCIRTRVNKNESFLYPESGKNKPVSRKQS